MNKTIKCNQDLYDVFSYLASQWFLWLCLQKPSKYESLSKYACKYVL